MTNFTDQFSIIWFYETSSSLNESHENSKNHIILIKINFPVKTTNPIFVVEKADQDVESLAAEITKVAAKDDDEYTEVASNVHVAEGSG